MGQGFLHGQTGGGPKMAYGLLSANFYSGQTVNISSYGFTSISSVQVTLTDQNLCWVNSVGTASFKIFTNANAVRDAYWLVIGE